MRFLGRAAFVVFLVLGVLIAVSNRQQVEIGLWPLPQMISMPLFLLVPVLLLLGVLFGLLLGWLGGASTRRNARLQRREADRLRQEGESLREELANERRAREAAVPRAAASSVSEQRALARQAALVDPEAAAVSQRIGSGSR